MKRNDFNIIVKGIIALWILGSIGISYGKYIEARDLGDLSPFWEYQKYITYAACFGLAAMLYTKSVYWLILSIIVLITGDVALQLMYGDVSRLNETLISESIRLIFISLVLCIRRDGISAWQVLIDRARIK